MRQSKQVLSVVITRVSMRNEQSWGEEDLGAGTSGRCAVFSLHSQPSAPWASGPRGRTQRGSPAPWVSEWNLSSCDVLCLRGFAMRSCLGAVGTEAEEAVIPGARRAGTRSVARGCPRRAAVVRLPVRLGRGLPGLLDRGCPSERSLSRPACVFGASPERRTGGTRT